MRSVRRNSCLCQRARRLPLADRLRAPSNVLCHRMLLARNITVEIGAKTIVDGVDLNVRAGEKVGLVGRNGAGKTTLLRVLGGAAQPKAGLVQRPKATGYLSQDPRSDKSPDDVASLAHVLEGHGLAGLQDQLEMARIGLDADPSTANVNHYSHLHDRFEAAGGYSAESEVRRLAAGVGLGADRLDLPLGALSGGERRRLELVRILFTGSELLLLDEPTNHLDAEARNWLLKLLRAYRGALVVVSHDLDLLDDAITRVIHIDRETDEGPGTLVEYKGTYSQYLTARDQDELRLRKLRARQEADIARLSTLANTMRGQTVKRARQAKSLDSRVARIKKERVDAPKKRRTLRLRFPTPPRAPRTVLTVTELWKTFGPLDVFADINFDAGRGERLLVMGLNGAGKTTLLRILAGQVEPDLGEVEFGANVSVGYYAQEHEGIQAGRSLLEHVRAESSATDG